MSRRWFFLKAAILLVVLGGSGFYAKQWLNSPSVVTTSITAPSTVLGSQTSLVPFQTTYMATLVPDSLLVKTKQENNNAPIVGSYLLKSSQPSYSDQVGITLGKLNSDSLASQSAIKLRTQNPAQYQPISVDYAPTGAIAFQKTDGYEKTLFWTHDNMYVAVAVSGLPQRASELDQTLRTIVSNWQWQ